MKQAKLNLEWTEVRAPIVRAHLRYARRRRQPDHRRPDRRNAADRDRVASIPIHFVFDGSEADFLRYLAPRRGRRAAVVPRRAEPGLGAARGRDRLQASRPDGFRRQRRQPQDRHHSRPRRLREQGRLADPRLLRPASAVRRRARRAADARQRDRLRSVEQDRLHRRGRRHGRHQAGRARPDRRRFACHSLGSRRRPTASSSTACSGPGQDRRSSPRTARSMPPLRERLAEDDTYARSSSGADRHAVFSFLRRPADLRQRHLDHPDPGRRDLLSRAADQPSIPRSRRRPWW